MNINPTSLQAFDCNCTTVTFQKREKKLDEKEDELSSLNWKVEFLGTEVAVQKPRKCDHATRLLNAWRVNLGIHNVMLEIGPSRLTVGDLWTLLPPHVTAQCSSVTSSIKNFVGGWLVDKVACS